MYLCAVNNILAEIMPRQERLQSATGFYHVMLRGINKQDIFEDDEDYLQMTACLQGLPERYDEKWRCIGASMYQIQKVTNSNYLGHLPRLSNPYLGNT